MTCKESEILSGFIKPEKVTETVPTKVLKSQTILPLQRAVTP